MYFELDKKGNLLKTGNSLRPHHIVPITPAQGPAPPAQPLPLPPHDTTPPPPPPAHVLNDDISDDPWIIRDESIFEQDFPGCFDFL
jgi:hypothetical protein